MHSFLRSDYANAKQVFGHDFLATGRVPIRAADKSSIRLVLTGDLELRDRSTITTDVNATVLIRPPASFLQPGEIDIQAENLILRSASQIKASAEGQGTGGRVHLNIRDRILITDIPESSKKSSAILSDGFGGGSGGDIDIEASRIDLLKGGLIRSAVAKNGRAGNISIETQYLTIKDASQISSNASDPLSAGEAGDLKIIAQERVDISGSMEVPSNRDNPPRPAAILAEARGDGSSGDIALRTKLLNLQDGAKISNTTVGQQTEAESAGTIILDVNQIQLAGDQTEILSETTGRSRAGDIVIRSQAQSPLAIVLNDGSQISATSTETASGRSGNISLESRSAVSIQGDGTLATTSLGQGSAGIIDVYAPTVSIRHATVTSDTSGPADAGNINIMGQRRLQIDRGQVSVSSEGAGKSGTISLASKDQLSLTQSTISARNAAQGSGGLIRLSSPVIDVHGTRITSQSSGVSPAGDITVDGNILLLRDRAALVTSSENSAGGNIQLNLRDFVFLNNQSQIDASAQGNGGNLSSTSQSQPWLIAPPNNRVTIQANSQSEQGGNVNLTQFRVLGFAVATDSNMMFAQENRISATGRTPSLAGQINAEFITHPISDTLPPPPAIAIHNISQDCQNARASGRSRFQLIGQGGNAVRGEHQGGSDLWDDTRAIIQQASASTAVTASPTLSPPIEAQGWVQSSGQIQLLATVPNQIVKQLANQCHAIL